MTHTLHRQGQAEGLKEDFVVFTMSAKTVNAKGSAEKMRVFFEAMEKLDPVNYGDMKTGNKFNTDRDTIFNSIRDTSIVHFVFKDRAGVARAVAELKRLDLGTSIIVSGLIPETEAAASSSGVNLHTVEFSGGVHGRTELLPKPEVLEVTTMCGHGMVAGNLVKEMANQVRKGKKTLEEAAIEMSKPCQCGIFNPDRAARLLEKML